MRERVRALLDRQGKSLRKLADALDIDHGEVSKKLRERKPGEPDERNRDFTMRQIDAVAEFLRVPPALLIQNDTSTLQELTDEELRLVKHWREWPPDIQELVLPLLDYFTGQTPMEREQRRMWMRYRRLNVRDRAYVERSIDDLWSQQKRERAARTAPAAPRSSGGPGEPTRESPPDTRKRGGHTGG
jgi:transcriptional regulator with XRE-family HTH domain